MKNVKREYLLKNCFLNKICLLYKLSTLVTDHLKQRVVLRKFEMRHQKKKFDFSTNKNPTEYAGLRSSSAYSLVVICISYCKNIKII